MYFLEKKFKNFSFWLVLDWETQKLVRVKKERRVSELKGEGEVAKDETAFKKEYLFVLACRAKTHKARGGA